MPLDTPSNLEINTIRALAEFSGQRVLEIGAGDGRLTWPFAPQAAAWITLDPDAAEVALAGQALRQSPSPLAPVRLTIGDGRWLPFPDGCFDLAFFTWSLC